MSFYQTEILYILSAGNKYLSVDRSNFLVRELPIMPGTKENPGLCFQGDERTGLYNSSEGELGISSLGFTSLTDSVTSFKLWNKHGYYISFAKSHTANRSLAFPDSDGTLALEDNPIIRQNNESTDTISPGMVVKIDTSTGVLKALGDVTANYGLGLADRTAAPTESLQVIYKGQFTLSDWTAIIGSANLTVGQRYYTDNTTPGLLATTGTQLIGIAINTTTLLLRIG